MKLRKTALTLSLSGVFLFGGAVATEYTSVSVFSEAKAQTASTRPERLNNPMAIEKGIKFNGEVVSSDSRFAEFATPHDGIRAGARNLLNYKRNYNIDNVNDLVNRYAPAYENPATQSGAYQKNIADALGVGIHDKIDLEDPATLAKVTEAILRQENGRVIYSQEEILAAVQDAYVNKPKSNIPDSTPNRNGTANAGNANVAIPMYTMEQLNAAGCDARVWNSMLTQYTSAVERHMRLATQVQVTNQIAAAPQLHQSCYDEAVRMINQMKGAINRLTAFLSGDGFDSNEVKEFVIDKLGTSAMRQGCNAVRDYIQETGVGSVMNQGMGIMNGSLDELKGFGIQFGDDNINLGDIWNNSGFESSNPDDNPYYIPPTTGKDVQDGFGNVVSPFIPGGGFGGGTSAPNPNYTPESSEDSSWFDSISSWFK